MTQSAQNRASLLTFLLVLGFVGLLSLHLIAPYAMALMMGALMALLVQPAYRWLLGRRIGPKVSAAIVMILLLALVITPILTFGTLAAKQAVTVSKWLEESQDLSISGLISRISTWSPVQSVIEDPAQLEASIRDLLRNTGKHATEVALRLAKGLPESLMHMVLAALAGFFFTIDGRRLVAWIGAKLPMDKDIRTRIMQAFKDTASSVVLASMAAAGAQAVLTFAVFLILGVPAASLALFATFILAWVPIIGSMPVWAAGIIYLFLNNYIGKMEAMIVLAMLVSVVDHVVRPMVLKGKGEMHPLVSLVAIFGGIQMIGIAGVFFGPILAAVLITLLKVWPLVGQRSGLEFSE